VAKSKDCDKVVASARELLSALATVRYMGYVASTPRLELAVKALQNALDEVSSNGDADQSGVGTAKKRRRRSTP
jgi:hypothetical protein